MGIKFVPGPKGEQAPSQSVKGQIEKALLTCATSNSPSFLLNTFYNRSEHFGVPTPYSDVTIFLQDIHAAATSKFHDIEVMGTEHSDPFGHSTQLIGQYDAIGTYYPTIVRDNYIRFKFRMDHNNFKVFRALNEQHIFHFIISPPMVVQLQLGVRIPIVMYTPPSTNIIPYLGKKYDKVIFTFEDQPVYFGGKRFTSKKTKRHNKLT